MSDTSVSPSVRSGGSLTVWKLGIPVAVVLLLVGLFWFGFGRDPSNVPNPLVGHAAPAFTLRSTSGQTVSLRSLRGRPVVINFFAAWCTTCIAEESNLVHVYRQWRSRATFLGVIYEDSPGEAAAFSRSHGGKWADLIDPHALTAVNYGVSGLPSTFFINRRGVVTGYTVSLLPSDLTKGVRQAVG